MRHSAFLPPNTVILQFTPSEELGGFGENSFDFQTFDRGDGLLGLNHPADQEVLLLGHGFDRSPFGQQQFLGFSKFMNESPPRVGGISRATHSAKSITAMT